MVRTIEVEGEMVRVIDRNIIDEGRLEDLLPFIETRPPITIGLLPKTAILVRWDESSAREKRAQFLCELAPSRRTMRYGDRRYQVSIPWNYFLFDFITTGSPEDQRAWMLTNSRVYWAREPVTSYDSMLGTALWPNCDVNGGICYGDTGVDGRLPLGVRMDRIQENFLTTTFTHDSGTGSPWQSETGSPSWARWDRESRENPNAWQTFPEWEYEGGVRGTRARTGDGRERYINMRPVRAVMGTLHDRTQVIQVEGAIPEMQMPFTFGRAEEWLATLTPVDRFRLRGALENMVADNPQIVEAPPALAAGVDDLGGEPI